MADYRKGNNKNRNNDRNRDGEPVRFREGQPDYAGSGSGSSRGGDYKRRQATDRPYKKSDSNKGGGQYRRSDGEGSYKPRENSSYKGGGQYRRADGEGSYKPRENSSYKGGGQYRRADGEGSYKPRENSSYKGGGQYKRNDGEGAYKPRENDKNYDARKNFDRTDDRQQAPAAGAPADAQTRNVREDELPFIIMGRNAVKEAIKSGRSIDRILVVKEQDGSLREIINLARDRNLEIREVAREKLDELCMPFGHGNRTGNHQGIVARIPGVEYCELKDILDAARERGEKPFIIILDGIEDPNNLGSIIRSAECAGAHGVVISKRRCVGVTASASKASAGACEYMRVARVSNIGGAIDRLKDEGIWIAGADMSGTAMKDAKLEGAAALVIGSEGEGISRLVKEKCDFLVSIPMFGKIDSLNAAVAAAVLMFEKRRQDG